MTPAQKIAEIYARERNAKIEWFWDGGFTATIGDSMVASGLDDTRLFYAMQTALEKTR